jgi:hypothetical protein
MLQVSTVRTVSTVSTVRTACKSIHYKHRSYGSDIFRIIIAVFDDLTSTFMITTNRTYAFMAFFNNRIKLLHLNTVDDSE